MTDVAYYQRRLAEELAAMGRSDCAKAAEAHREMAELYRVLLENDAGADGDRVVELSPGADMPGR